MEDRRRARYGQETEAVARLVPGCEMAGRQECAGCYAAGRRAMRDGYVGGVSEIARRRRMDCKAIEHAGSAAAPPSAASAGSIANSRGMSRDPKDSR